MTNIRYKYLPQMQEYDFAGQDFVLYSMFTQKKLFSSDCINTDRFGFRYSKYKNENISVETELYSNDKVNILIGGSTVFGVGSTNDDNTISSYLSESTGEKWINIGIRAGNSFQEYITLLKILNKFKNIGNIVFMSGINDIYLSFLESDSNSIDDTIFGGKDLKSFLDQYNISRYSLKRKIVVRLISFFKRMEVKDIIHLKSISEMVRFKRNVDQGKLPSIQSKEKNYFKDIFDRNFLLYSSLNKSLVDTKVTFCLQPFFNWIGKKINQKEQEIFNYLENIQKNENIVIMNKIDNNLYEATIKELNLLSEKYNYTYYDLNKEDFGNEDKFTFVDRVHMTDEGNQISANAIRGILYP